MCRSSRPDFGGVKCPPSSTVVSGPRSSLLPSRVRSEVPLFRSRASHQCSAVSKEPGVFRFVLNWKRSECVVVVTRALIRRVVDGRLVTSPPYRALVFSHYLCRSIAAGPFPNFEGSAAVPGEGRRNVDFERTWDERLGDSIRGRARACIQMIAKRQRPTFAPGARFRDDSLHAIVWCKSASRQRILKSQVTDGLGTKTFDVSRYGRSECTGPSQARALVNKVCLVHQSGLFRQPC